MARVATWMWRGLLLAGAVACTKDPGLRISPGIEEEDAKYDGAASASRVELKLTATDPAAARDAIGLEADDAQARQIWFYDTPSLALFEAGVILRGRRVVGDDDDSTVKLRPLVADEVHPRWFERDGFKCEVDRAGAREVSSCSLSRDQGPGEVFLVGDGRREIRTLFDPDQLGFLAEHAAVAVKPDALTRLGPIEALVWKVESDDLDGKVTFEHWTLADGRELLEISQKVDAEDADDALDDLTDWLDDLDVAVDDEAETKTRAALEALAAAAQAAD